MLRDPDRPRTWIVLTFTLSLAAFALACESDSGGGGGRGGGSSSDTAQDAQAGVDVGTDTPAGVDAGADTGPAEDVATEVAAETSEDVGGDCPAELPAEHECVDGQVVCKAEHLTCCFDEADPCCLNSSGDYFNCSPDTEPMRCNGNVVERCEGYAPTPPECNGGADWVTQQDCGAHMICTLDESTSEASCAADDPVEQPTLSGSHSGWKKAKCWSCHQSDEHNPGLDPYQCVPCHGKNGAPGGHSNGSCSMCHSGKHGDGFPSPDSCKVCHPN